MNLKVKNGQSLEVCKTWDRTPVDKRLTLSLSLSLSTSDPHLGCVPLKERGGGERQRLRTAGKTVAKPGRSTAGKDLDTANFTSLLTCLYVLFMNNSQHFLKVLRLSHKWIFGFGEIWGQSHWGVS